MKVYGDGGGMFAQVFGKSEQPIYDPSETKEPEKKSRVVYKQSAAARYARKHKDKIADSLKDPDSKYHGTIAATQVPEAKRCNCPKCQQALEERRKRQREYNRKMRTLRVNW